MYHPDKLYPEPQTETKPAWNTLEALAEWLAAKPADETYCHFNTGACLFAQYGHSLGFNRSGSDTPYYRACMGFWERYSDQPFGAEPFTIARAQPHTFGAAAARCRAEIARRGAP